MDCSRPGSSAHVILQTKYESGLSFSTISDFPGGASDEERTYPFRRCKRRGFDPWVGKTPLEEGTANPLQDSCLETPRDRGAWRATARWATKSWITHLYVYDWMEEKENRRPFKDLLLFFKEETWSLSRDSGSREVGGLETQGAVVGCGMRARGCCGAGGAGLHQGKGRGGAFRAGP